MADYILNVTINGAEQSVQTIGQLEQALKATNDELAKTDANSDAFTQLQQQAVTLDAEMNKLTQDAQQFNSQLNGVNATTNVLNDTIQSTAASAQQLGNSTNVNKLTDEIQQSNGSAQSLRAELRKITQELQGLEPGSARFIELSTRAGELRDTIGDTNATVTALAGNTTERLGTALSGVANVGITGLQGVTGAMQLFGVQSEEARQVLEKLQGLLLVTQSIQGFGALPDAINNIKAGFASLLVVKEADIVATEAQAVASTQAAVGIGAEAAASVTATGALGAQTVVTEGTTVATTALGFAMKALPIVAVVAGIATLAAGVYNYLNASNQAKKAEEERKKRQEELTKAQNEAANSVAKESAEFVNLVYQVKLSNAGSKERLDAINRINSTYGTTLKNIQDEQAFQDQLNVSIEEYTTLQFNRFKLEKNTEYIAQQNAIRFKAEQEQNKLLRIFNEERRRAGDVVTYYDQTLQAMNQTTLKADETLGSYRSRMGLFNADLLKQEALIRKATQATENLQKRRSELLKTDDDLTDNGKKYGDQTEKNNKTSTVSTKIAKEQAALAQFINDLTKERIRLEDDQAQKRVKQTTTLIDDLHEEQRISLRNLKDRYDEAIKTDALEVKEKKKTKSEKTKIDEAYNAELAAFNSRFKTLIKERTDIELEADAEVKRQLKEANDILTNEIKFGDSDVADQKTALNQKIIELSIKEIDRQLENDRLDLASYQALIDEKLRLQGQYAAEELNINTRVAEANRIKDLDTFIQTQEQLLNVKIVTNKKLENEDDDAFKKRIEKDGEYVIIRENGEKVLRDNLSENELMAYENVIKQKENLDQAYATTITELTTEYVNENAATQEESDQKVYQKRLDLLQEFFSLADDALSIFQQGQTAGFAAVISGAFTGIQQYFKLLDQDFANFSDKLSAYAAAIGGIVSSVLSAFIEQNQANLEQDLTNLQIASDARKDILTQEYNDEIALLDQRVAQGLITEQQYTAALKSVNDQYNAGIKGVNDKLAADQRKQKEKAFKDEKNLKIAQAVISGLQGAVQAFAGAMQLGPIAGPIVGAILAAAVAGLAAANVAQIKKTQFDGGASIAKSEPQVNTADITSAVANSSLPQGGGFTTFSEGAGSPGGFVPSTPFSGTSNNQRVYVVESDITAAQNRVRVLEENSTFG
jgi:hypothetical protein